MEDMYVKPGNQERGWNDPPQFSYGLQKAHGPQKNLLNKRATPGSLPTTPPSTNPLLPPPCIPATPPLNPAHPVPVGVATPAPPAGPIKIQKEDDSSQSEPDIDVVMSALNGALDACRSSGKNQVCNDVAKRLRLLEDGWRSGKLSQAVRRRMETLSQELLSGRWDSADEVHRSLMVDHVTEVSQWMVGVKRLIAETRNLSPELLEPLLSLKGRTEELTEPVQEATEPVYQPVKPVQEPIGPVQEDTEPAQKAEEAVKEPAEPVQDHSSGS